MVTPKTHVDKPGHPSASEEEKKNEQKVNLETLSSWMTRDEAARLVGIAVQTIIAYEKRGLLHPQYDQRLDARNHAHRVTVIDPQELLALRQKLMTSPSNPDGAIDTSTWYTRNEACASLSISTQTLKNYEARGLLHPIKAPRKDPRGHEQMVVVYDPKELSKLERGNGRPFAPRTDGETEAKVYAMIEEGKTVREIVVALRETSEKIHAIKERWENDGGSELIITTQAKTALEALLGPFRDVTDLVELVLAKVKVESDAKH